MEFDNQDERRGSARLQKQPRRCCQRTHFPYPHEKGLVLHVRERTVKVQPENVATLDLCGPMCRIRILMKTAPGSELQIQPLVQQRVSVPDLSEG